VAIKEILQELKDSVSEIPRSYLKLSVKIYQSYQLLGGYRIHEVKRTNKPTNSLKSKPKRSRTSYPIREKVISTKIIPNYQEVLLVLEKNRTTFELVLSKLNSLKKNIIWQKQVWLI